MALSWVIPGQIPNITANIDGVPASQINLNIADAATQALWPNITGAGKPQDYATYNNGLFANLPGQITTSNYQNYFQQNTLTGMAYARSTSTTTTYIDVSLAFNSFGGNVIFIANAKLRSHGFATIAGNAYATIYLYMNGTLIASGVTGTVPNIVGNLGVLISLSDTYSLANVAYGTNIYTLRYTVDITGDGVNAGLLYPSLQIIGLR